MPVIYRYNCGGAELVLWQTTESEQEFAGLVTASDAASAREFTSLVRRLERLAWRAALRSAGIAEEVEYDEFGAPCLVDSGTHIGVSHCRGAACVLVSPGRCAVDMESASRDCSKGAARFLSPREREFVAGYANPECVAWCAKEALYKYSGQDGLDFLRDITIEGRMVGGLMPASVAGERVEVRILEACGYVVAVIV